MKNNQIYEGSMTDIETERRRELRLAFLRDEFAMAALTALSRIYTDICCGVISLRRRHDESASSEPLTPAELRGGTMKLSEAILLGSTMKPQSFISGDPDKSCALEAAADAIGNFAGHRWCIVISVWPWTRGKADECPVKHFGFGRCKWSSLSIVDRLYHLNDYHHWTRPAIAEYVASIEPKDIATIEPHEAHHDETPAGRESEVAAG